MGDKMYRVTDEYILAKIGVQDHPPVIQGYYRGQILPAAVTDESIEHHLSTKQIEEFVPAPTETSPAAEEPASSDKGDGAADQDGDPGVKPGDQVDLPAKNAKRGKWVDYAVSKGADRDDILTKNVTRDDLIAAYGPKK
jgi:hypothetical protein